MSHGIKFTEEFNHSWLNRIGLFIEQIESPAFRLCVDLRPEDNRIIIFAVPQWFGDEDTPKLAFFSYTPFDLGEVFYFIVVHGFRKVAMQLAHGVDESQDWYFRAIQAA